METVAAYIVGIVVIVLGLGLSIGLHEVGHLVPAKKFGVRVTEYMIGFGPMLFSRRRGETLYGLKAIPAGGYIRMIGMYPLGRKPARGPFAKVINDAREADHEDVGPEDEGRTFYSLSVPKKLAVMLGGPTMNLLLSVVFIAIVMWGIGLPEVTTKVSQAPATLQVVAQDGTQSTVEAPAHAAGLRQGDVITSVNGTRTDTFMESTRLIQAHPGEAITVTINRDGHTRTLSLTPVATQRQEMTTDGKGKTTADGKPVMHTVGVIGVVGSQEMVRQDLASVPRATWQQFTGTVGVIVHLPQRMADIWHAAFDSGKRDPNGPMGPVGVGRVAGEVASSNAPGFTVLMKVETMLSILGGLNMALFVFNLIPLLPLDGGHVAGALWEACKRAVARVRGAADPGATDTSKLLPVTFAVFIVMTAMGLLLAYADIVKPVNIFGN